jgi:hypothetical protein
VNCILASLPIHSAPQWKPGFFATYEIPGLNGYGTLCTPVPLSSKENGESSKQFF